MEPSKNAIRTVCIYTYIFCLLQVIYNFQKSQNIETMCIAHYKTRPNVKCFVTNAETELIYYTFTTVGLFGKFYLRNRSKLQLYV